MRARTRHGLRLIRHYRRTDVVTILNLTGGMKRALEQLGQQTECQDYFSYSTATALEHRGLVKNAGQQTGGRGFPRYRLRLTEGGWQVANSLLATAH